MSSEFLLQDKIFKKIRFLLCQKFKSSSCSANFYGKTKHHFKAYLSEHMRIPARTGRSIKLIKYYAESYVSCDNIVFSEFFSGLSNSSKDFRIKFQERLFIHRNRFQLNKVSGASLLDVIPLKHGTLVALGDLYCCLEPLISAY